MISEQNLANVNDNGPQPFAAADDVSTITASANTQANQQRMVSQVTLDNISQALNRRRSIGAYHTISHRRISAARKQNPQKMAIQTCRAELDSHADTCGVNNIARILEYTGQVAEVRIFTCITSTNPRGYTYC
jgi:fructose-bisphosphate aldolase class 1